MDLNFNHSLSTLLHYAQKIPSFRDEILKRPGWELVAFRIAQLSLVFSFGVILAQCYSSWNKRKIAQVVFDPLTRQLDAPAIQGALTAVDQEAGAHKVQQPYIRTLQKIQEKLKPILLFKKSYPRKFLLHSSKEPVDEKFVHYLLGDFVGGGKGDDPDRMVRCFNAYISRFCDAFPSYLDHVSSALSCHIPKASDDIPLEKVKEEMLATLKQKKQITFSGGYRDGDGGGHATFCELLLDERGMVSFRMTNPGEGLGYHPKNEKGHFYRTLVFSGATIQELEQSQFLPLIVSCLRNRPKIDENSLVMCPRLSSIRDFYLVLVHGWPGKDGVLMTNPGKAQRANSCSLQAVVKWFKWQCDKDHHPWMILWIKLSAFSDYLKNNQELSSQFISDAKRKLATHIEKMDQRDELFPGVFEAWKEISILAAEKKKEALKRERILRVSSSLSSTTAGLGLENYELVRNLKIEKEEEIPPITSVYRYPHTFPGNPPPISELPNLSQRGIAPLTEEMVDRMNFIRLLPDCTEWETIPPEAIQGIETVVQLFFYDGNPQSSVHVPDGFCADLLNAWMGVYFQAKQEGKIPDKVLLEWMRGVNLLIQTYTSEFIFDTEHAKKRWTSLLTLADFEEKKLLIALGPDYEPPENHWTTFDRNWDGYYCSWMPFGIKFKKYREGTWKGIGTTSPIKNLKELPEMAHFSRQVLASTLQQPLPNKRWDKQSEEERICVRARKIERWDTASDYYNEQERTIQKVIDSFGVMIEALIPHYDALRFGLASIFVFADRHLSQRENFNRSLYRDFYKEKKAVRLRPGFSEIAQYRHSPAHPCIESLACYTTRLKQPKSKPECVVAKAEEKFSSETDLNARVLQVFRHQEREYPFMTEAEEKEFLAFVQKGEFTRFSESLIFFEKALHKLAIPEYQMLFKYLLFGGKGRVLLEKNCFIRPLLFSFFMKGYETLLKKGEYTQVAAAALFHLHLILFSSYPKGQSEKLLAAWKMMLTAAKRNPILGQAFGKAIFSSLSALENVYEKIGEELPYLLASTALVQCIPGDYTKEPYHPLEFEYGWHSFKALIQGKKEVWHKAAIEIFGEEEAAVCLYDEEQEILQLKNFRVDLISRALETEDESSMEIIPKELKDYDFEKVFGMQNFFAKVSREKDQKVYSFIFKKGEYQIFFDAKKGETQIFKRFGEEFYLYSCLCPLSSFSNHFSSSDYHFWIGKTTSLIEEKKEHRVVLQVTPDGARRYGSHGELRKEKLASLPEKETFLKKLVSSFHSRYFLWVDPDKEQIAELEFPQLSLHFYEEEGKLLSEEFPGYFIAEQQYVPFLKNYRSFIVIENLVGRKKIITLNRAFQDEQYLPFQEKEIFVASSSSGRSPLYFVFNLEKSEKEPILPPRLAYQSATTWLISLYLRNHEYHQALQLLEETELTSQRTILPDTKKIVASILFCANNEDIDTHPYAVSIRLQLRAWCKEEASQWDRDLERYHNLENSMGRFALDKHTLDFLSSLVPFKSIQKDLESEACGQHQNLNCTVSSVIRKKMVDNQEEIPSLSLTVPGEDFVLNFLHYFELRTKGNREEQKRVKTLAYFAYQDPTPLIALLGHVLWCGKEHDLRALFQKENDKEFQDEFLSYVRGLSDSETNIIDYPVNLHRSLKRNGKIEKSKKTTTAPRKISKQKGFIPLPPIAFSLPISTAVADSFSPKTAKAGNAALEQWAKERKERFSEEPTIYLQFERLEKGAREREVELPLEQPACIGASQETLKAKEKVILEKANHYHDRRILHLDRDRGVRRKLEIDTLLISLGRQDLSVIKQANPSLSEQEIKELMQDVFEYALLLTEGALHSYDPRLRPELAVFEALSGLILRKEQIEVLDMLEPGVLFEARTGFGKSKVLLPLWLLLSSNKELTILISPANLFDEQDRYLQNLFKKNYHLFAKTIEFSRESIADAEDIAFIESEIKRAKECRRPVFMSDKTAHNLFILKPKELILSGGESFEALLNLRKTVKNSRVFIEEPQKVLDDRQEFNYAMGKALPVEKERIAFTCDLYRKFFVAIGEKYHVEFWPTEKGESLPLTEEVYRKEMVPDLVGKENEDYLLGKLSSEDQVIFEREIKDPSIRLLHDQLHTYLPQTMMRNCDEHYTLNQERIAIPLEDSRNPRKDNEFVSIDQILNFTLQANLKTPFSLEFMTTYLQGLIAKATDEAENRGCSFKETQAYLDFLHLTQGMTPPVKNFLVLQPNEMTQICDDLNRSLEKKLLLIEREILPKVRHFEEKVSSTPHLLTQCFTPPVGASGTLAMQHFPFQLNPVQDDIAMVGTISALLQKQDPITVLEEKCSLQSIREKFPEISAIIEVGAGLRHYPTIEDIGKEILSLYPEFDAVGTFDLEGNPVVMTRKNKKWVPEESYEEMRSFWFYGQKDTTGRDKKLDPLAQAVLIINKHTTLTNFIQGAGRMRGLLAQQRVKVVMDLESALFIKQAIGKKEGELTLLDLIEYFTVVEGEKNGVANFRSLSLQLDALIENEIWDDILAGNKRDAAVIKEIMIQSTKDDVLLRPSFALEKIPFKDALKMVVKKFNEKVKRLALDEEKMEEKRESVQSHMIYPQKVIMQNVGESSQVVETTTDQFRVEDQAVEQEKEGVAHYQTETVSTELASSQQLLGKSAIKREKEIVPISFSTILSQEKWQHLLPQLNENLKISYNALCTFQGDTPDNPGFINGYAKPLHYVVELLDGQHVMIDTQEAEEVLQRIIPAKSLFLIGQGTLMGAKEIPAEIDRQAKIWMAIYTSRD